MQEVIDGMKSASFDLDNVEPLREAMKDWAIFCLTTLDGDLQEKGLGMAGAISSFLNALERSND